MNNGPVHWLENVDGDPQRLRLACRKVLGKSDVIYSPHSTKLLDPNRAPMHEVTCPECLAAMNRNATMTVMPKFDEVVAAQLPRLEVMFQLGPDGSELFQWGMTAQAMPVLSVIGAITRAQAELPLLEPGDSRRACPRQSIVFVWEAGPRLIHWYVGPDLPLDPLVGYLEVVKDMLISSQMAQRAASNQSRICGPDGSPMRG